MRNKADVADDADQTGGVQSVMIVLGVMEYLAAHDAAGVTEIATALGATKARVFRHLRTLVAAGYASQDEDSERYAAGPRLAALGHAASLDSALVRQVAAVSVGVLERGEAIRRGLVLDLEYEEDHQAAVDCNLVASRVEPAGAGDGRP